MLRREKLATGVQGQQVEQGSVEIPSDAVSVPIHGFVEDANQGAVVVPLHPGSISLPIEPDAQVISPLQEMPISHPVMPITPPEPETQQGNNGSVSLGTTPDTAGQTHIEASLTNTGKIVDQVQPDVLLKDNQSKPEASAEALCKPSEDKNMEPSFIANLLHPEPDPKDAQPEVSNLQDIAEEIAEDSKDEEILAADNLQAKAEELPEPVEQVLLQGEAALTVRGQDGIVRPTDVKHVSGEVLPAEDDRIIPYTEADTLALLNQAEIDYSAWGITGVTKDAKQLTRELNNRESELKLNEKGKLVRYVRSVRADIHYTDPQGTERVLHQTKKNKRPDGTLDKASRSDLLGSVSGKAKVDESAADALGREIEVELQEKNGSRISGDRRLPNNLRDLLQLAYEGEDTIKTDSRSYPNLPMVNTVIRYSAQMPREHYNPQGYREVGPRSVSYFTWHRQESRSAKITRKAKEPSYNKYFYVTGIRGDMQFDSEAFGRRYGQSAAIAADIWMSIDPVGTYSSQELRRLQQERAEAFKALVEAGVDPKQLKADQQLLLEGARIVPSILDQLNTNRPGTDNAQINDQLPAAGIEHALPGQAGRVIDLQPGEVKHLGRADQKVLPKESQVAEQKIEKIGNRSDQEPVSSVELGLPGIPERSSTVAEVKVAKDPVIIDSPEVHQEIAQPGPALRETSVQVESEEAGKVIPTNAEPIHTEVSQAMASVIKPEETGVRPESVLERDIFDPQKLAEQTEAVLKKRLGPQLAFS